MKIEFPVFKKDPTPLSIFVVLVLTISFIVFVIVTFTLMAAYAPWVFILFPFIALYIAWKQKYFVIKRDE